MNLCFEIFLFFFLVAAGPVAPTEDLTSKSTVKNPEDLNLPYNPVDLETTEDETTQDTYGTPEANVEGENTVVKNVPIDWTKVPYISSKNPNLPHAPDPEL